MYKFVKDEDLTNDEKLIIENQYSYQKIRNDLSQLFKSSFFRDIFRRHFDDYMGRNDALKVYVIKEIFGMFAFFIFGLIMMMGFILTRYYFKPFNTNLIMEYIANIFIYASIFVSVFILCLAIYNILRIVKHRNIYGILFGFKDSNYLIHVLQYTYVLNDKNQIMPIYFSININESQFDQIIFNNHNIIDQKYRNKIMEEQYDSNERFICMLHNVLIDSKLREFENSFNHLDGYYTLLKSTKGTMLK